MFGQEIAEGIKDLRARPQQVQESLRGRRIQLGITLGPFEQALVLRHFLEEEHRQAE
jgi:hypothetical protein